MSTRHLSIAKLEATIAVTNKPLDRNIPLLGSFPSEYRVQDYCGHTLQKSSNQIVHVLIVLKVYPTESQIVKSM